MKNSSFKSCNSKLPFIFMIAAGLFSILSACSAGSNSVSPNTTPPPTKGAGDSGYVYFNESEIYMTVGETVNVSVTLHSTVNPTSPIPLYVSDPSIITTDPSDYCSTPFNQGSCNISIMAIAPGTTFLNAPWNDNPLLAQIKVHVSS